jgi:type IV secretion system protein VirD4
MNVHFVIDEAGSLGHIQAVENMLAIGRGYGVRLQFYYQDIGQLKKCWPSDDGIGLMANTIQVFFGVNDSTPDGKGTANYISQRLGSATIKVESGGTSRGENWQSSYTGGKGGIGYSANTSTSWQQAARDLLKVDEVLRLSPRTAITFVPGLPPIQTTLLRYYEEKWLWKTTGGRWHDFRAACRTLINAVAFLALAGLVALLATRFMQSGGLHGERSGQSVWPAGVDGSDSSRDPGGQDRHGRPVPRSERRAR